MSTLYIIGNGFDLAHGLKTTYYDFRKYLMKYSEKFLIELEKMYGVLTYESVENSIDKLWKDFEFQLSHANDNEAIDFATSVVSQISLESGLIQIEDTLDDYFENQYGFISKLNDNLKRWARQVRLTKAIPKNHKLLNN